MAILVSFGLLRPRAAGASGAAGGKPGKGGSANRKRCTYCGMFGHEEKQCRKKANDNAMPAESEHKRNRVDALEAATNGLVEARRAFISEE